MAAVCAGDSFVEVRCSYRQSFKRRNQEVNNSEVFILMAGLTALFGGVGAEA